MTHRVQHNYDPDEKLNINITLATVSAVRSTSIVTYLIVVCFQFMLGLP